MKKIITLIFLNFSLFSFMSFSDEIDKDILKKNKYLKQERIEKELREKDSKYKLQETVNNNSDENKFYISKIILVDTNKLLDNLERDKILGKYINKKLGSTDITNILIELTNKLIENGYITSVATISENNDLTTGILKLKIVAGKVDKIIFNSKLKKVFLVAQLENKPLNIRNLDATTENFNYLESNNVKIDIIPSDKVNYSNIIIKNKMKEKCVISLLTNKAV